MVQQCRIPVLTNGCTDLPTTALILMEFGARTEVKDKFSYTPVQLASKHLHMTMYRGLLEGDINSLENLDAGLPRVEMHVLKPSTSKINPDKSQTLTQASISKDTCDNILSSSTDCDLSFDINEEYEDFFQERSVIQYAIENGDPMIVQTLVEAGVGLNNYEEKGDGPRYRLPLYLKAANGWLKITELLSNMCSVTKQTTMIRLTRMQPP